MRHKIKKEKEKKELGIGEGGNLGINNKVKNYSSCILFY